MRILIATIVLVCAGLFLTTGTNAGDKDKKEVTLKGKITCPKCDLGTATECGTVIVVKDDKAKKEITYWFDKDSNAKYHDDICSAAKNGTVVAIVKDMDKKKVISVKKLEYAK